MVTEQNILDVITYFKGFTGFEASVVDYETGSTVTNLVIRKATFYQGNSVLVFEFDVYKLVVRDALDCSYSNPYPTTLRIIKPSRNMVDIRINGLASTMDKFFGAFIPRTKSSFSFAISI